MEFLKKSRLYEYALRTKIYETEKEGHMGHVKEVHQF